MKSFRIKLTGIATLCLFSFAVAQKPHSHQEQILREKAQPHKPTPPNKTRVSPKPYTPPDPWEGFPLGKLPKHLPEGMNRHGGWIHGDKPGYYSHWTAEAWTGNDEPFLAIRRSIDAQVKAGKKPMELLQKYKAEAKKEENIGDAKAQFAWAYAAFVAYQKFQKGQNFTDITKGVAAALERPKSPKSYQYARMRAIFTQWDEHLRSRHTPFLRKVVLRLTKRDSKDFSIKYIFAFDFANDRATIAQAMEWAKEYHQAFPKKPAGLFLLAAVHEAQFGLSWVRSGKKLLLSEKYGKTAIESYQHYLAAAPSNDLYRGHAKSRIQMLRERIEKFRKAGMLRA